MQILFKPDDENKNIELIPTRITKVFSEQCESKTASDYAIEINNILYRSYKSNKYIQDTYNVCM